MIRRNLVRRRGIIPACAGSTLQGVNDGRL